MINDDPVASNHRRRVYRAVSRRSMLGVLGAAAGGLTACGQGDRAPGTVSETAAAVGPASSVPAAPEGDHLRILGTAGGPVLGDGHSQPALALVIGDATYLVDCGGNTPQRIVDAHLGFAGLRNVFITHHHPDHVGGLPVLGLLGWTYNPSPLGELTVWGPPPLDTMVAGFETGLAHTTDLFTRGGFRPRPLMTPRVVDLPPTGSVEVMRDDRVIVTATRVFHGPELEHAYAYRFDLLASGRSVVFSGDTTGPNEALIALAQGADVLVHEVQMTSAIDQILERLPPGQRAATREHLLNSHTDVAVTPEVAQRAGVGKLVLHHYAPISTPPADFLKAAQDAAAGIGYQGEVLASEELGVIPV